MQINTLCLLVKGDPIEDILLGLKKVGFGEGKCVGVGGTVEEGETVHQTAVRELKEETSIEITEANLEKVAKITFFFPGNPAWDRLVYVFLVRKWRGEPKESREINPEWFKLADIPYESMWQDAAHWLPILLEGRKIVARFTFEDDNETIMSHQIEEEKDFLWPQIKSLPYFRALLRAVEASFYQGLELPEPVLDVGSGDGHFASLTFDQKLDVGIDPWWGPLRASKKYMAHKGLVNADGAEMPFPSDYFASGLSNSVLEHIEHIDEVLADIGRVLKPGAPFVFCVPNPDYYAELAVPKICRKLGLKKLGQVYEDWFGRISRTVHADPPEVWENRLEKAGFSLEQCWDYFSPEALRVLEWGHYFGVPCYIPKIFAGQWIASPTKWNLWLTEHLVRPFASTEPLPNGTYTFFIARKR